MNLIAKLLPVANVLLDLEVSSKKRVFERAGLLFENNHNISRSQVFDSLFARERLGSTGLGQGVAIPHGRIARLAAPVGAFLRLKVRGVAGVLSDGAMRDTPVISGFDFPVYCTAGAAPPSMANLHPVDVQTPVGICGVPVYPGDVIVADDDGAIVVPRHLADEVGRDSFEQERLEKFVAIRIGQGREIPGVYPPNDQTKKDYAEWIKAGEPPDWPR